jgi:hypothetical protein
VDKKLNSTGTLIQKTKQGGSSRDIMYYTHSVSAAWLPAAVRMEARHGSNYRSSELSAARTQGGQTIKKTPSGAKCGVTDRSDNWRNQPKYKRARG